jgi:hypothetical protein
LIVLITQCPFGPRSAILLRRGIEPTTRCSFSMKRNDSQRKNQLASHPSFAGLVALAGSLNPIPSRTRPLNSPAPMVLSLKAWKSRSLPGLQRTDGPHHDECVSALVSPVVCPKCSQQKQPPRETAAAVLDASTHANNWTDIVMRGIPSFAGLATTYSSKS